MVPVFFKQAVEAAGASAAAVSSPGAAASVVGLQWWRRPVVHALLAAGACRTVSGVARDLQAPVFQLISQVQQRIHTAMMALPCSACSAGCGGLSDSVGLRSDLQAPVFQLISQVQRCSQERGHWV